MNLVFCSNFGDTTLEPCYNAGQQEVMPLASLRELREHRLLTQKELAERVGVSAGAIYKMESGKTGRPRFPVLRKLGEVLDVDPNTITFGEEAKKAS